jgi:DNA modification methylase
MPLNITRRALELWTNGGDVVFSPFMGIGSEGVASLKMGRRFIGTELKPEYFRQAVRHLQATKPDMGDLFAAAE